ncbi:MAG TPA: SCO family protein [Turneriella sp.]|nr:SCO family protein [Turneriella sp.]
MRWLSLFIPLFCIVTLYADLPPADDTLAKTPPPLEVTVEEKLGAPLASMQFFDEEGKPIKLSDLADGHRPIVIAPVYYNCPHLCTLTLNGLMSAIEKETRYKLGKDYLVVAYSFHPDEKFQLAQVKQANYLRKLSEVTDQNLPEYRKKWRFFTGNVEGIAAMSKAIGFKYLKEVSTNLKKKDEEYIHPAVLVVTTPDLKISRYLYGVEYSPIDFKMSLLEAADGKITKSVSDRLLLTCYSFDPIKRKYSLVAWRVMRLGGIVALVLLGALLAVLWVREKRRRA